MASPNRITTFSTTVKVCGLLLTSQFVACVQDESNDQQQTLTVFAAASTADIMKVAAERFEQQTDIRVVLNCDASSRLARQIIAGAPADVFVCANEKWMDEVAASNAFADASRRDLLTNNIVLIAPAGPAMDVEIDTDVSFIEAAPDVWRIAMGDPLHVPAGMYAKQAMLALGWWEDVESRIIFAQDVRSALRLVEIGEADAGIVYVTDAAHTDSISIIGVIPSHLHDPIRYPAAQCTDSKAGAHFIEFLHCDDMLNVFREAGFQVVSVTQDQSP